ncbi:MAG: anthranilate phosphoribosyltransferase [Flavobacteriales bacterium]
MKALLNRLFDYGQLTREEARELLVCMSAGELNPSQMAAFLSVFVMRDITAEELNGFREALLELRVPIDFDGRATVDLCGTGGDGKNTFNVSTLAAFITAGAGYAVTKHGNYGVSSVCGSSNVLEHLGYTFTAEADVLHRQLDAAGICFLHAPKFHPAMKTVAPVRRELGIKTFFNMLGPLVNPCQPQHQVIGVFNLKVLRLYQFLHEGLDKNVALVHSLDGYDEISLTGGFKLIRKGDEDLFSPELLGLPRLTQESLYGGETVGEAADLFVHILKGHGTEAQKTVTSINAGAAIQTFHPERSLHDCYLEARTALDDGRALNAFTQLLNTA